MKRLLTPDLDATVEIDLLEEHHARECESLTRLRDREGPTLKPDMAKAYSDGLAELEAQAASYRVLPPDQHVMVRIGYMPAAHMTALRQAMTFSREKPLETQAEIGVDVDRRTVRMGLREWKAPGAQPFALETERVGRLDRPVCPWEVVDAVERSGLLRALADAIWEFQKLGDQKKTRSWSAPGTSEKSSTAPTASTTSP